MLAIESFDGSADPIDHIKGYRALMALQKAFDTLLCFVFSATLKKVVRVWFFRLPQGFISSFEQLERLFITYFDSNRPHLRYVDSLFSVQQ